MNRKKQFKMKTTLFFLAGIAAFQLAAAQDNKPAIAGGTVKYEEKMKVEIKLDGDGAQFAHMLPKERKTNKVLYFSPAAASYLKDKEAEADQNMALEGEGGMMQIRMYEPDNQLYTDLENKKQVEQQEFMSRMFLIESDMGTSPWKLTGNEKEILGYTCQEAFMEKDSIKTIAWFTPSIPVPAGPASYNNLPGLVLAVDINDGNRTITAISIDSEMVAKGKIVKPKEGKKVTEEEFKQIREEKMKEMGIEHGEARGGQQIMIRIQK